MAVATDPIMCVRHVSRWFRRGAETVAAVHDTSLELYQGELAVAAGPSGSGKTTLLSIMAGVEAADGGEVVTAPPLPAGVPPGRLGWRHLAFVPQALALLDELSVAENVELAARLDPGAPGGWATADLLDLLEIGHLADRYPSETSGGEQQRTALARSLRLRPPLLIGDEPTGHQDRERIRLLLGVLRQHALMGAAVLISSHDEEVIAAADRVITVADGQIVSDLRHTSPVTGRRSTG